MAETTELERLRVENKILFDTLEATRSHARAVEEKLATVEADFVRLLDQGVEIITVMIRGETPSAEQRAQLRQLLMEYEPEHPDLQPTEKRSLWDLLTEPG